MSLTVPRRRYFEDLHAAVPCVVGPYVISEEELDRFLELSGERYPIHTDASFAKRTKMRGRVIPGTLLHAFASARLRETNGPLAIQALRVVRYDHLRPVYPGARFFVSWAVMEAGPIDSRRAAIETRTCILDEDRRVLSIGLLAATVRRKQARRVSGGE